MINDNQKSIELYGEDIEDIEVSPFESIDMLHRRSKLEQVIHELSNEERIELINHDMKLLKNAKMMSEHIGKIYDFSLSKEPLSNWWWHLDKVANGKIEFRLVPVIVTEDIITMDINKRYKQWSKERMKEELRELLIEEIKEVNSPKAIKWLIEKGKFTKVEVEEIYREVEDGKK